MGAADGSPPVPEVRLRDLRPGADRVEVVGRIVSAQRREVTRRSDGRRQPVLSGLLSDGTGTVRFTWWDPPAEGTDRGAVVRAVGAEVREFRGRPELTFSWKTRVGPAGPAELPKIDPETLPMRPVRELKPREEGFRIEVRVLRILERTVSVGEERRVVFDGIVADRSGAIALSSWNDFGLSAGDSIRISGAYVGDFRGRPQLVIDGGVRLERIGGEGLPNPAELLEGPPRRIADVEDEGGGEAVAVEGTVLALLPPSGIVYRCPTCARSVRSGICRIHGPVEGVTDLRARLVVDDGTGSVTVAAGREATERLWGVTLAEAVRRLRETPDPSILEERLLESVLGRRLRVRGRATQDDFGITIVPESIEAAEVDLAAVAQELSARLSRRG